MTVTLGENTPVSRHYRTRIARWILYPYIVPWILIAFLLIFIPHGEWWLRVGMLTCLIALLWIFRRAKSMGVEVT